MTQFRLLCLLSGVRLSDLVEVAGVSMDTLKSWSSGRLKPRRAVMLLLRRVIRQQEQAATAALALWREKGCPDEMELQLAASDEAARARGWPCVGSHAMVLARIIAALPPEVTVSITEAD